MLPLEAFLCVFLATAASAQANAHAEVRAALEDKAPLPSRPLSFPVVDGKESSLPSQANESGRLHAHDAAIRSRSEALARLPAAAREAHDNLGNAGQSAVGQAKAEEAKKNSRGTKPPRPPPPKP